MSIVLGASEAFAPTPLPEPEPPKDTRHEELLLALAQLREQLGQLPTPEVHVDPVDLTDIVTAVNGLRPNATADDIADAVKRVLIPALPQVSARGVSDDLAEAIRDLKESLDFRLQGIGRSYGASGPSNISDNAGRQLGIVSVTGPVETTAADPNESRLDYDVRTDGNPVYVGEADPGAATDADVWTIKFLTYDADDRVTRVQVKQNVAWDSRSTLGW